MSKLTIYGTQKCVKCRQLATIFEQHSIPYDYKSVGTDISKEELEYKVGRSVRSVPVLFDNAQQKEVNPSIYFKF